MILFYFLRVHLIEAIVLFPQSRGDQFLSILGDL